DGVDDELHDPAMYDRRAELQSKSARNHGKMAVIARPSRASQRSYSLAFTRQDMLPGLCLFSYMSWCAFGMSANENVSEWHGSTFFCSTSSLNSADCLSLAKCEPCRRFWRIHR